MEHHLNEKFLRYVVKSEVEGRATPMFGFVSQKEYEDTMELNKINRTIVKFQWDEGNEHV